ncbi:hypothetical protein [Clostridium thermobutyricum]|uniref:hypothetical protein n=1 Tax=Clostridium thermobutyricum TaxID=29372 RepID=UPI002943CA48|nr:hypothetical protein [Clostridium thermobutyricum]
MKVLQEKKQIKTKKIIYGILNTLNKKVFIGYTSIELEKTIKEKLNLYKNEFINDDDIIILKLEKGYINSYEANSLKAVWIEIFKKDFFIINYMGGHNIFNKNVYLIEKRKNIYKNTILNNANTSIHIEIKTKDEIKKYKFISLDLTSNLNEKYDWTIYLVCNMNKNELFIGQTNKSFFEFSKNIEQDVSIANIFKIWRKDNLDFSIKLMELGKIYGSSNEAFHKVMLWRESFCNGGGSSVLDI